MKIQIQGRPYDLRSAQELSLLDLLTLERETRELGRPLTMAVISQMEKDVETAVAKADGGTKARIEARQAHPESPWLLAVAIWAARRHSGDPVSFEEAISFPLSELVFLSEEGDEVEANPQSPRPVSGRGAKPHRK